MRRLVSALVLILMVASLIAACGTGGTTPTTAPTTGSSTGGTGTKPEDPMGVVEIKPGEPLVLGFGLSISGSTASLGEDSRNGIAIALDDIGNQYKGHKIELTGEDTGCTVEGGQAAGNKLVSNQKIVAIIGTTCSDEARGMVSIVDSAGMVLVSPSNTAPDLTDPAKHNPAYLRTAHNDKVQGRAAAEFALGTLKITKAATIHDGSTYGSQLAAVFAAVFKEKGGTIVAEEAVNKGDTDMRPVLTRVASTKPELIYYPIFVAEGGFITRQAKEVAGLENVKLMGSDGMYAPEFIEAAGDAVKGMYLSSPDLTSLGPAYDTFLQKHQAKFNKGPLSVYHANAYDAVNVILAAVDKVAVTGADGTLWIPRSKLREALYATNGFKGLTGSLTCDPNGDCADPKIAVYEVTSADLGASNANWPNQVTKKIWP
jgi:branched-chain amino acid transport system substrate-binding protein